MRSNLPSRAPDARRLMLLALLMLGGCYDDITVEAQGRIARCEASGGRAILVFRDARYAPSYEGMLKNLVCARVDSSSMVKLNAR